MTDTEMIPWDELFPGSLNADSIGEGNTIIVTITSLRKEPVSEIGPGRKPTGKKVIENVMRFEDYSDWWVMNKTNKDLIGKCLGTDTKLWKGRKIALTSIKTGFFGGALAIRVSGGEGMSKPIVTRLDVSQSKSIDWTLTPIETKPKPTATTKPPDTRTTAEKIASGEKHLGPDVTAEVRTAYGAKLDADPADWGEDTQQGYLVALMKRAKGA